MQDQALLILSTVRPDANRPLRRVRRPRPGQTLQYDFPLPHGDVSSECSSERDFPSANCGVRRNAQRAVRVGRLVAMMRTVRRMDRWGESCDHAFDREVTSTRWRERVGCELTGEREESLVEQRGVRSGSSRNPKVLVGEKGTQGCFHHDVGGRCRRVEVLPDTSRVL